MFDPKHIETLPTDVVLEEIERWLLRLKLIIEKLVYLLTQ